MFLADNYLTSYYNDKLIEPNMAAAQCKTRGRKALDYAKLNAVGTTQQELELEDGQLQDSPLHLNPSDDEFPEFGGNASSIPSRRREDDENTLLDYEDDLPRDDDGTISITSTRATRDPPHG